LVLVVLEHAVLLVP
jgi:hypothetical protein